MKTSAVPYFKKNFLYTLSKVSRKQTKKNCLYMSTLARTVINQQSKEEKKKRKKKATISQRISRVTNDRDKLIHAIASTLDIPSEHANVLFTRFYIPLFTSYIHTHTCTLRA